MSDAVQVRITPDGTCFIDDEYFAPPPGASLNEAVLAHLQLEAAALETSIRAVIHDQQADYTMAIQVNTDGTSQPLNDQAPAAAPPRQAQPMAVTEPVTMRSSESADPVPPDRPYEPLPEPYRSRLEVICATARKDLFADAARDADQLLTELSSQYGPNHLYTLAVGFVRSDIAWLAQDFQYALQLYTYMARAWNQLLGPQHSTTIRAVGNTIACWKRLQPAEALAAGDQIVQLLQQIAIPASGQTIEHINRQLVRISVAN
jgi:hypothetical protein